MGVAVKMGTMGATIGKPIKRGRRERICGTGLRKKEKGGESKHPVGRRERKDSMVVGNERDGWKIRGNMREWELQMMIKLKV